MRVFLTSVADHAHGRRRENEDAPAEKSQFPEHHDLLPEEADELGHAACGVSDLLIRRHTNSLKILRVRAASCGRENLLQTFISGCMLWLMAAPQALAGQPVTTASPLGGSSALLSS